MLQWRHESFERLYLTHCRVPAARSPTTSTSEKTVSKVPGTEPWKTGGDGKYQYYPGGDPTQAPRDAPSALNTVIIPNVNLPKVRIYRQFYPMCPGRAEVENEG